MENMTGKSGEKEIARLLKRKGWKILTMNYRCRFGEIDVIARDGGFLAFIEVKTREVGSLVSPWEAITPAKQRRLRATAEDYLVRHPSSLQPRFDAAAVYTKQGKIVKTEYLTNAFI